MVTATTEVDTVPLHTVLIISDQPNSIAVWETLFTQRNCIVLAESIISRALQSARLIGPSLMLIDMQLSKSERDILLEGLRSSSRGPILMLVSANTAQDVVEANQAGADECLVRPVNPAVLLIKAMAWLGHGERSEKFPSMMNIKVAV